MIRRRNEKKGDYWRRPANIQLLYMHPWNKERDPDQYPSLSSPLIPRRWRRSARLRRHLLQARLVALWDVHSLQLNLVLLVSGSCVGRTGAGCQLWSRYLTSPPNGPMTGVFDKVAAISLAPWGWLFCQNIFVSIPIRLTSVCPKSVFSLFLFYQKKPAKWF